MTAHKYGWVPDLPDHRDHLFAAPAAVLATLPPRQDLRPTCPPVYDQGELGSCTANAIAGAIEFDELKQHLADVMPSRLFIYYNERAMEGTVTSDSGAQIRDGIKTIAKQGVCPESEWPYDVQKFTDKPPVKDYVDAKKTEAVIYQRLLSTNLNQLKGCLAAGYPFIFGFTVYESFESDAVAKTGEVQMPGPSEKALGGHAVMAVGYDDASQRFTVRNSWGPNWGMKGYFTIPYAYVTNPNLADDFWKVTKVT